MPAALLALLATGAGFVLGLILLRVLGEKAWHHAIALSVGVFFVVYIALLSQNASIAIVGTSAVSVLTLLFWYAGFWSGLVCCILALVSYATLGAWSSQAPHVQQRH